jgi:hypothetical protein
MTGFAVEEVRRIAESYSYVELSLNEESRVISFRSQSGSARINVYYTTGTVGTCLNHPKRGKTQLFRRETDMEQLDLVFQNPRSHTGKGYYRKTAQQLWKSDKHDFERDSARRWRFVAAASGLSTKSKELNDIAEFCSDCDDLYWDKGDPPDLFKTKFASGSRAALLAMVVDAAQELYSSKLHIYQMTDVRAVKKGKMAEGNLEPVPVGSCCNVDEFLDTHSADVTRLKNKLRRFPKRVRLEVIRWFVSRDVCGARLFDENYDEIMTKDSDRVDSAHHEYGELMYPKKAGLCPCHGVLFTK